MTVNTRFVNFEHNRTELLAEFAYDDADTGPRPGIMVCHNWAGRGENDGRNARRLAELGYTGFAVDLYGKGVLGSGPEENAKLMQPFVDDRGCLQSRLAAARAAMCEQPEVDAARTAVIGFCFGGLCALDMARAALPVQAAVSFHGLFVPAGNIPAPRIDAKVMILHGWDDPMATPDDELAVPKEMTDAGADWQLHAYGGTAHAFSTPGANNPDAGTVYHADADRRSWQAMVNLLAETFD